MRLNAPGHIVHDEWLRTEALRPNVELDAFVVMPNHFHGIIVLDPDCGDTSRGAGRVAPWAGVPTSGPVATCPHETARRFRGGGTRHRRWMFRRMGTFRCMGTSRGGGHLAPWAGVPTSGHVATCPYGIIRNVAAGGRCIVGGCGIVVARHVVGGTRHRRWTFRCRGTLLRAPLQRAPTRSNTQIIS